MREEKGEKRLQKLYFQKLERNRRILIYRLWFLETNWIYYDLLKINKQKIPEMKISVKIIKLTYQMISKSRKSYMNRKLKIRGFQRNQNYKFPPCILGVIALKSQRPNSDWFWIVVGQTTNWKVKSWWKLTNQIFTESWLNKESNETNSLELDLRSGRNCCSKIRNNLQSIWVKWQNFQFLNSNYLSKSNLNYLNCKDYEGITLLS